MLLEKNSTKFYWTLNRRLNSNLFMRKVKSRLHKPSILVNNNFLFPDLYDENL